MCRLVETVKIKNKILFDINYHNNRFNRSRKDIFNINEVINLKDHILIPETNNIIKCRIIYDQDIIDIEYKKYEDRKIDSLKIVYDDKVSYTYKYLDRSIFKELLDQKEKCDDILIVKNRKITDTSFSNIIFFDGTKWVTPDSPLLKGTKRTKLLDEGKIIEEEIKVTDLKIFKKAMLINTMLDMENNKIIDINKII